MPSEIELRIARFYKQVGQKVREARNQAHLTQTQLAHAVALTRTSITNLEAGRQHIPLHVLAWIATVLEVRADDLLPETSDFDDLIVMPDLTARLANADERMRDFVQNTVAKVAMASRNGSTP